MRWRTRDEVLSGKGETICCNKVCQEYDGLRAYETVFKYQEKEGSKTALVKVKCCVECAAKLNHKVIDAPLYKIRNLMLR